MPSSTDTAMRLWSDEPSAVDLLAFGAVADTVVDAVLDDALDPLALGVSGAWGSGKTTVLRLVELALSTAPDDAAILTVPTDPWRFDPTVGAKESLISAVLSALENEIKQKPGIARTEALGMIRALARRVDWAKAIKVAAKASVAFQLPSVDDLTSLIRADAEDDQDGEPRGLEAFREEFTALMASEEFAHLRRVVVLVDDLDRCLPETVVETLETIRLFLAVPKMAFVIAADEERVADAIRKRYPGGDEVVDAEAPATLYLHKIVQTTVPLPALSRFDTEAYLLLLQLQNRLADDEVRGFVAQCGELRMRSGDLDDLQGEGVDITAELQFAARLTPLLYEKLRGNPRRIKRFLNDLTVRQAIAGRRGIILEPAIVAKLMVLEVLLRDEFAKVLQWLAHGQLRAEMARLETAAGRRDAAEQSTSQVGGDGTTAEGTEQPFAEDLIRWAKLPPALATTDLGPYLYLAASFSGTPLLDSGLPAHLRDIATNLVSSVRAEQKSVTDEDLRGLTDDDAKALLEHLARMSRDRPTEQKAAMTGLLRTVRLHSAREEATAALLRLIPPGDLEPATVLLVHDSGIDAFKAVLKNWLSKAKAGPTKNALKQVVDS